MPALEFAHSSEALGLPIGGASEELCRRIVPESAQLSILACVGGFGVEVCLLHHVHLATALVFSSCVSNHSKGPPVPLCACFFIDCLL